MNKNGKAAIAVGAGVLLLLGGSGTLALWNNSSNVAAGTIASGTLDVDTTGVTTQLFHAADFNDASTGWLAYHTADASKTLADWETANAAKAVDAASYTVVPGDSLVLLVTPVTLKASGGNLFYTLGLATGSITTTDASGAPVSGHPGLTIPATASIVEGAAIGSSDDATAGEYDGVDAHTTVYGVTSTTSPATTTLGLSIPISFDASATQYQGYTYDLGDAAVAVQQVIKH